jgi:preprotein translocase subunit SecE
VTQTTERPPPTPSPGSRQGPIGRSGLFYRQMVAELRKVIWPTRSELITYTVVALVFVVAMILFVALCDYAFGKAVLGVFG